jgi:hypothetical protein
MERLSKQATTSNEHPVLTWNRVAYKIGMYRITKHPLQFALMAVWRKIPVLWGESAHLGWSFASRDWRWTYPQVEYIATIWHWLMLFFAGSGAFKILRSPTFPKDWGVTSIYLLAGAPFFLVHLLVEVQPRYHHLFLPLLAMLIAQGWGVCFAKIAKG